MFVKGPSYVVDFYNLHKADRPKI